MSLDDEFAEIIQEAIEKANRIKCPVADYRAGLRSWIDDIQMAAEAAGPDRDE